jgi:hypothetical protein
MTAFQAVDGSSILPARTREIAPRIHPQAMKYATKHAKNRLGAVFCSLENKRCYFTASLKALAARNFGTFMAGT